MVLILKILTVVFVIPGMATVLAARWIVKKYALDRKMQCEYEDEMTEEEIAQYKNNKAVINVKMAGMLIALPGFIAAIIAFR